MNKLLKYEMCAYPPSIFDSPELLRKPYKANFGKSIRKHVTAIEEDPLLKIQKVHSDSYLMEDRYCIA